MNLDFPIKEPDKAYVSNSLWLPKMKIREEPFRRALEFMIPSRNGQALLKLWDESKYHLVCPREFIDPASYSQYDFPFIDLRPEFEHVDFKDLVVPRNAEQEAAWAALSSHDNGILNLGCGKGKTKLALKKIAQMGVPTLIIVPDGGIMAQWQEAIYGSDRTPPGLKFKGGLGIIQSGKNDFERPITIALVTSLGIMLKEGRLPDELIRRTGLVIYDEVHRIGAPMFSLTASPFYGDRIGLTATVNREDGLDPIYRYHIGNPFYVDLKQDLIPRLYFQRTPVMLDLKEAKKHGQLNISVLRSTLLGTDLVGNVYRYWSIKEALDQGRKILCLSHSKLQLRLFHAMFPNSGLIIAEVDKEERLAVLRSHQITFAISRLGSEGADDDALDTLFWLTPFRAKNSLQQSMGRIQRYLEGKKTPVMVVFEDALVGPLKSLCRVLKNNLQAWGLLPVTLPPAAHPTTLPPEVQQAYDATIGKYGKQPEGSVLED